MCLGIAKQHESDGSLGTASAFILIPIAAKGYDGDGVGEVCQWLHSVRF